MKGPEKYHVFGAADIERYYSGEMPAWERHALEKAALDDPFLADALEGYAHTATPATDLDQLRKALHKKLALPVATPSRIKKYQWLAIAALLALLLGSGWLFLHQAFFPQKGLAARTPASLQKEDSLSPVSPNQATLPVSPSGTGTRTGKDSPAPTLSTTFPARTQPNKNKPAKVPKAPVSENAPLVSRSSPASGLNQKGWYDLQSAEKPLPDSNLRMTTASTTQPVKDSGQSLHVVLQPLKKDNEVVEVGLGARKNVAARPEASFGVLEPAEGWNHFNEYLAENLEAPEEIKGKTPGGEVELSFDINGQGEAVDIKVEKSLCGKCDEEAVRLLKKGPKWKITGTKKGRIAIHF